jgi:hypothetical protein
MPSALVLGGAASVWDDLAQARALGTFDAVFAVNDAAAAYPGEIEWMATLHPEHLHRWLTERERGGYPRPRFLAAHAGNGYDTERRAGIRLDYQTPECWPGLSSSSGSSGLFATKVAIEKGFDRVVLCGVPMDPQAPHFFDPQPWQAGINFWEAWELALPHLRDKVRSMSGRTRELLGAPSASWIAG